MTDPSQHAALQERAKAKRMAFDLLQDTYKKKAAGLLTVEHARRAERLWSEAYEACRLVGLKLLVDALESGALTDDEARAMSDRVAEVVEVARYSRVDKATCEARLQGPGTTDDERAALRASIEQAERAIAEGRAAFFLDAQRIVEGRKRKSQKARRKWRR